MIRFFIGFFLVYGVVGGLDTLPPDVSYSYMFWMLVAASLGLSMMISGVNKVRGE